MNVATDSFSLVSSLLPRRSDALATAVVQPPSSAVQMSAQGYEPIFCGVRSMSALSLKVDVFQQIGFVLQYVRGDRLLLGRGCFAVLI